MAITLQIKDSDGEVQRITCDDFGWLLADKNLHIYEGADEQKELVGVFQDVVYWKVVKPEKQE